MYPSINNPHGIIGVEDVVVSGLKGKKVIYADDSYEPSYTPEGYYDFMYTEVSCRHCGDTKKILKSLRKKMNFYFCSEECEKKYKEEERERAKLELKIQQGKEEWHDKYDYFKQGDIHPEISDEKITNYHKKIIDTFLKTWVEEKNTESLMNFIEVVKQFITNTETLCYFRILSFYHSAYLESKEDFEIKRRMKESNPELDIDRSMSKYFSDKEKFDFNSRVLFNVCLTLLKDLGYKEEEGGFADLDLGGVIKEAEEELKGEAKENDNQGHN